MIELDSRLSRSSDVLAQRSGEHTLLLNPSSGEYYTLDEVGGRIWELCDGTRPVSAVVAAIQSEYEAPAEAIESDVVELLDDLARERLVSTA